MAELLSNILIRSLALVGEEGIDSFSGLEGLERGEERFSRSLAAAATEVEVASSAAAAERPGESVAEMFETETEPVRGSAEEAALLNMPRIAARELLTDPAWDSGRLAVVFAAVADASAAVVDASVVVTIAGTFSATIPFSRLFCEV